MFVVSEDRLLRTGSLWFKERLLKLKSWIGPSFGNLTIIVSKGRENFNYRNFMEAIIELDHKEIDEEDALISKVDIKTKMHLKVILQARHRNHCCKANVGGLLTTNNR